MNKNPNYVLKTNEAVIVQQDSKALSVMKVIVWVLISVIILGSLFFQENLFAEITWSTRILLIVIAVGVMFSGGKKEFVASPMEIQFFDNYLIVYRPKRYYSKRVTRMEINKLMYSDIKRCVYKTQSKRIHIYGDVHATWHNFDNQGTPSQTPTYNRFVKDTICYFSTRCAMDVDFKTEIETHSPIRVILEDR